ncbi:DNA ligase D [Nitrosovibrio sp. Nv17]|uniref:DNA ligase D n=1 Tax=Nitrosovibrio sp. Nv17 TaxID=1855339 RepID=UPI000908BF7D|nr:DNA ligase D [Nitrosovibrio sp. Nv17]SFW21293.1 ATP-dependent DNA ligase LigD phosphoesterase module /ATP-dependent DNA ligase LigD polymerase module [Nitrosovibrio sp. Nv17]
MRRRQAEDALAPYRARRDFSLTSEPEGHGEGAAPHGAPRPFVIQKHWATRLHYDFRLELGGVMKSWAVPKGPSLDPQDKRMAIHVEDHPIAYNRFEGRIPAGQYGAGRVIVWDRGTWQPLEDPERGYREGKLRFELEGHKLKGAWVLVRMKGARKGKQDAWLLIKEKDGHARPAAEYSVVEAQPASVIGEAEARPAPDGGKKGGSSASGRRKVPVAPAPRPGPGADLPAGAVRAELPATLQPQLATLVDSPPADGGDWAYEIKFDGYRILSRVADEEIRMFTRNGHDWSGRLPHLVQALRKLPLDSSWLDGEIAVPDAKGIPDFQALQNAFEHGRTQDIVYHLFDLPFHQGHDLRQSPLAERRRLLERLVAGRGHGSGAVRFSESFSAPGRDILASACRMGLEGVIGKRQGSFYVSRRSREWVKLKCGQRQEFVVGGYTDPRGGRAGLGSLLLGFHDGEGKLRYAGRVGTGFSDETLRDLAARLSHIAAAASPFVSSPNASAIPPGARWVQPRLVAEVAFGGWTREGRVRHAVFHGLRADKDSGAVTREQPLPAAKRPASATAAAAAFPHVTHPERVIDPSTGFTKLDLVRYYDRAAPLILAHLRGRPVSFLRAPDGVEGQHFFQKHMSGAAMPDAISGIKALDPALDPGHPPLIGIIDREGLLSAAQMNAIEFHTWNATKNAIVHPDRMVFDLDPGSGAPWEKLREAALLLRGFLEELGLRSFLKASGGKGLHVVVPLKRQRGWEAVKEFSQAIVAHLAATIPDRFVARSGPRNRVGRIFIDYLRNGRGATTVCAWSVRARSGLGLSVPMTWEELETLAHPPAWSAADPGARLAVGDRPWAAYAASAQPLAPAMRALGFRPGKGRGGKDA